MARTAISCRLWKCRTTPCDGTLFPAASGNTMRRALFHVKPPCPQQLRHARTSAYFPALRYLDKIMFHVKRSIEFAGEIPTRKCSFTAPDPSGFRKYISL
ncbi:MAG: hypothetical protein P1V20_29260 [Verrucomicrobiales bacterium]|nr:hypothetical protein [Verrucomicrobiales bacterium]